MREARDRPARIFATASAIAIVFVGSVASVRAAEVSAELSSGTATVGEQVELTLAVRNAERASNPVLPKVDGMTLMLQSQIPNRSDSTLMTNGRITRTIEYSWTIGVAASRPGRYVIPPIRVRADGRLYRTQPLNLVVSQNESSEVLVVEVDTDRREAYVEEPIQATLRMLVQVYRQGQFSLRPDDTWRLIDNAGTSFGPFKAPQFADRVVREDGRGGTATYYLFESTGTIWPEQPGPLQLGEVHVTMKYPQFISSDIFGGLRLERWRQVTASPRPSRIEIHAIPEAGRPPDYNGAVGTYTIEASAQPTNVSVGDPITLKLSIRGSGRLERLSAPLLSRIEELGRDFKIPDESLAGRIEGDAKVFAQTIRAAHPGVRAIPPIPFSFFNPRSQKFETARSESIPLKVREASRLSMSQVVESPSQQTVARAPIIERTEGLLANYADPELVLSDQRASFGWPWVGLFIACPAAYLATWLMQRRTTRYREDVAYRRRISASADARKLLRRANGSAASAGAALSGYVADRLNAPSGSLTREDVRRLLNARGVRADLIEKIDGVLGDVEIAQFGGGRESADDALADRAIDCLSQLERVRF